MGTHANHEPHVHHSKGSNSMSKAKPTHMRPILEEAIATGQLFNRDQRKATKWALATIDDLTARLAAAEAAARWWRMAARGYILEEGEVHPDERWPWLVDEAADEAVKGGRDE